MKKPDREDLIFLLIGLLLLGAMLLTFLWGGNRSRHGVGMLPGASTADRIALSEKAALNPGQGFSLPKTV
jgi:hypothetical protein